MANQLLCANPDCKYLAEWGNFSRPVGWCCWACQAAHHRGCGTAHGKHCWHRVDGTSQYLISRSKPDVYEEDDSLANKCKSWLRFLLCKGAAEVKESDGSESSLEEA